MAKLSPCFRQNSTWVSPLGFVFGHQLLRFRATPPAPNFYHLCLIIHPLTASPNTPREQMGCSNAYGHQAPPSHKMDEEKAKQWVGHTIRNSMR